MQECWVLAVTSHRCYHSQWQMWHLHFFYELLRSCAQQQYPEFATLTFPIRGAVTTTLRRQTDGIACVNHFVCEWHHINDGLDSWPLGPPVRPAGYATGALHPVPLTSDPPCDGSPAACSWASVTCCGCSQPMLGEQVNQLLSYATNPPVAR